MYYAFDMFSIPPLPKKDIHLQKEDDGTIIMPQKFDFNFLNKEKVK